jgi:hypothetical protein
MSPFSSNPYGYTVLFWQAKTDFSLYTQPIHNARQKTAERLKKEQPNLQRELESPAPLNYECLA